MNQPTASDNPPCFSISKALHIHIMLKGERGLLQKERIKIISQTVYYISTPLKSPGFSFRLQNISQPGNL